MVIRVLPFVGRSALRFAFEKSYSGLICAVFGGSSATNRNQPDRLAPQDVDNNEYVAGASSASSHESLLALSVWINAMHCKRVHKHAFRIRKRHAVLTQIPRRLGRIELKVHLRPTVCMLCIRVKDPALKRLTPPLCREQRRFSVASHQWLVGQRPMRPQLARTPQPEIDPM